jgi:hypothetical protein
MAATTLTIPPKLQVANRFGMDNKPKTLTNREIEEIARLESIQNMWGTEDVEEMEEFLRGSAYAVKFDFVSGSQGYVGDYYIIQGTR